MKIFVLVLQHLFLCVKGDLFTGPGSFYVFSNSSRFIGDRAVYDEDYLHMYYARDFMTELKNVVVANKSTSSRILQQSTSWLLVGDSTEQRAVQEFCVAVAMITKKGTVGLRHTDGKQQKHAHCTITISSRVRFQIANMFIFGYAEPTNSWLAKSTVHPLLHIGGKITAVGILTRALAKDSPFLIQTFGTATMPPLISMHSCLWDLNEHHGVHNKYYHPYLPISYFEGAKKVSQLISSLAPQSRLVVSTCKPLNYLDKNQQINSTGVTRSRDGQTALDGMISKLMSHRDNVIHDKVDSSMLFGGFEHYAADGRHYLGKAALTIINTYLNCFDRLFFESDAAFMQTLLNSSTEKLVAHINATYLV